MAYQLKPFVINQGDLNFLLKQINFIPLFDAQGNAVVNWNGVGTVYTAKNSAVIGGTIAGDADSLAAIEAYGIGFPSTTAPIGIRDISGYQNNLYGTQGQWGKVDMPFVRVAPADYSNYLTSSGANYMPGQGSGTNGSDAIDYMPRIISRTITNAGVNLLVDSDGHFVEWRMEKYGTNGTDGTDPAYGALINASGANITKLVEGAKIVAPAGLTLAWDATADSSSVMYATLLTYIAGGNPLAGSNTGGQLVDGADIYKYDGINYVNTGLKFDTNLFVYHSLVTSSGVTTSTLTTGDAIFLTPSNIATAMAGLTTLGDVEPASVNALLKSGSGYGLLEILGHIDFQNPNSGEFFIGSENPGVAPVNSWFGIFGQFFDHGLDKLGAGGNGKITIALETTDPLYRAAGTNGPFDLGNTKITVTRATITGTDTNGDPAYINHTSPFIDQSQTYGSHEQLTNVLRKWVDPDGNGIFQAGMELLDGTTLVDAWERRWPDGSTEMVHDTLPTLKELNEHLLATGRDPLTWDDVLDLRNRDDNGNVILSGAGAGSSGSPLLLDMNPHFNTSHMSLGTQAALANMGILPDINGNYALGGPNSLSAIINFATFEPMSGGTQQATDLAKSVLFDSVSDHYVAGDGRVNENFGLTAIHHVFHEEHNYQVENLKTWIYAHDTKNTPTDHAGLHEWQVNTGNTDANGNYIYANGEIAWDQDKMFNGTKLIVEMEYQHAAIDQYARTVTPRIQEFVGYSSSVDPTVSLEYAQVAFRFGHSTIRETIDTIDPSGWFKGAVTKYALEAAFLAPQTYAKEGAAAITLGLSRQQMNEVDEFLTPALNQGLLGQPLDLAAINIARGRDMGIPTLNDFREAIGLTRYVSWADFGANMIHPESLVNFIAAYSFNGDVAKATEIMALANGSSTVNTLSGLSLADAIKFMNNDSMGGAITGADGFIHIDSWMGGLAEAHVPGGLLGETFDAVFVAQMQALMDGDRFYYLYRLFGTQIGEEVNNGQFKDLVERNTGLTHLNGSIFAYADKYYNFAQDADLTATGIQDNFAEHGYATVIAAHMNDANGTDNSGNANTGLGIFSDGGTSTANNGNIITVNNVRYINDIRPEIDPTKVHTLEGTPTSGADSHEVIVGTEFRDFIEARAGDDTIYGEAGDDILNGGAGIDRIYGGAGNDVIDAGEGPDLVDGGAGDDLIYGRGSGSEVGGFDQLVGSGGNDTIIGGEGIDKLSGGAGDDVIFGDGIVFSEMGNTDPFTHGGDGNDYIDGGASGDLLYGDEGDDLVVGSQDQDIVQGNVGDDILRPGNPSQAINGGPDEVVGDDGYINNGFDLIDFSDYATGAALTIDLFNQANPLVAIDGTSPMPAMFQVEGIIGTRNKDTIIGDSAVDATAKFSQGNNWLVGGSGNDTLQGKGGNDVIIGDGIRLDSLIGTYSGTYTKYDTYADASHRNTGILQNNGLLDFVNFDKHYTEMLRSAIFKDIELGGSTIATLNSVAGTRQGDGGTAGTGDTAVFSGNSGDYTFEEVVFTTANQGNITAYKIAGIVGTAGEADGTDIVVGVENFMFANGMFTALQLNNNAPTITSDGGGANAQLVINENTAVVTTVTATDVDGDALAYSIIGGADAALFTMEQNGVLSFITAPDFETPLSFAGNNIYEVIVQVSDGVKVDTQTLTVTNKNVDESAAGVLQISSYQYDQTAASLTATNTLVDPDGMTGFVRFQWQQQVANNWVNIVGATGESSGNRSNATIRVQSSYNDPFGVKTVTSSETAIIGNSGNNFRAGTLGNEYLIGLAGDDTLQGGAGNDTVDGGAGNDRLIATIGDNNDLYIGGAGTDTYDLSSTTAFAMVNLATNLSSSLETGNDTLLGIENVIGSFGKDAITDGIGSNVLDGRGGNDIFFTTIDNARDTIDGGAGNDTVDYSAFTANLSVALAVNSFVNVSGSGSINANRDQIRNIENFIGGSGNDTLTGDNAANALSGGNGTDILNGGSGADTLNGGTGADILNGGTGADILTGGVDSDNFVFNSIGDSGTTTGVRDIIMDFTGAGVAGGDLINLSGITGTFTFVGTAAFTTGGQSQVRYGLIDTNFDNINDATLVQLDNDNDVSAESSILLVGVTTALYAGDFVL